MAPLKGKPVCKWLYESAPSETCGSSAQFSTFSASLSPKTSWNRWIGRLSLTNDEPCSDAGSPTQVGILTFVKISLSAVSCVLSSLSYYSWSMALDLEKCEEQSLGPLSSCIGPRYSSDSTDGFDVIDRNFHFFLRRRLSIVADVLTSLDKHRPGVC
jgi:hypothetical protein